MKKTYVPHEKQVDPELGKMNEAFGKIPIKEILKDMESRIEDRNKIFYTSELICFNCGKKYGKPLEGATTCSRRKCGICGEVKSVCHQRHYGYFLESDRFERVDEQNTT